MRLKWELDDILPLEKFKEECLSVEESFEKLDYYYSRMSPDMSVRVFKNFLNFSESITGRLHHLYYRAALEESADMTSDNARMLKNKTLELDNRFTQRSRRIWHWIRGKETGEKPVLDKVNAERLFAELPQMQDYLRHLRDTAAHLLSEREEMIISEKDLSGISPILELRNIIETGFSFEFAPSGKKKRLIKTQAELIKFVHSSKGSEREAAYYSLLNKYKDNLNKFFTAYRAAARDWSFEAELRGYPSAIGMRNSMNRIPDASVDALLAASREKRGIYQDFFRIKASALDMKRLNRVDIYAPLSSYQREIPLDEGIETVLAAFGGFSDNFRSCAEEIINRNHIDSAPSENKQSGAFCASPGAGVSPYILLNYNGTSRDLLTLAHELGHGVHSLMAKDLSPSVMHAGLPLAETASTFGEMLVFEALLKKTESETERRSLVCQKLQESFATILRQVYFVLFEIEAHSALQKGVTPEELSEIYLRLIKEEFGESVEVDDIFRYEWAYIPHIVNSPFYCYAYAFGELLSLSLYSRYRLKKEKYAPEIESIFAAGGSVDPVKLLSEKSFNIGEKEFWLRGFKEVERLLDEIRG